MKKGLRRVAFVAVSTLVAIPAMAAVSSATPTFAFDRVAGGDRYLTSVETAKVFGNSSDVILASGVKGHFPDALSASYLAGIKKAPVMLTTLNTTPTKIAAQIAASGAKNVWIVGGTGVVSAAQEATLATKYTVKRLGGSDRYITSAAVIAAGGTATTTTAVLATGQDFPDALGGGALSYAKTMPLAITKTTTLPAETQKALTDAGIKNVIILGGPDVVSANVVTMLTAAGITSTRIFGADRAETSAKLAEYELTQGFSNTAVNVASGYRYGDGVDALGGAAVSGKELRPLLITDNQTLVGPGVEVYLKAHAATLTKGHIFGGIGAVTPAAEAIMLADAKGLGSNQAFTVTPNTATTKTVSTTATGKTNQGLVSYTATGLDSTKTYSIALFDAADVSTSASGLVKFDTATRHAANTGISIEVVNGTPNVLAATGAGSTYVGGISPVAGSITFGIDSVVPGDVVPVLFNDADASGALTFATAPTATVPQAPSEAFGVGGDTIWNPAMALAGAITGAPQPIASVDKTAKLIVTSGANAASYTYDSNDTFFVTNTGAANQLTLAEFEALINAGDTLNAGTVYTTNPAFVSTFVLGNISPAPPTLTSASPTDTTATLTVATASIISGATVNAYVALGTGAAFTTATKKASSAVDADATTAGFQIKVTGLTASKAYTLFVTQTTSGQESAESNGVNITTTLPTDAALVINSVTVNDVNDGVGTATKVIVVFNKAVTAATATGLNVSPTAQAALLDPSTAVVVSADGLTATYTMATAINDATPDVAYTATVAAGAATTADGVSGKIAATFSH